MRDNLLSFRRKLRTFFQRGKASGVFSLAGVILVGVFALAFWHSYYHAAFRLLIFNDAQDYASMSRNLLDGRGFLSQYMTPMSLVHHGLPQPNLWRAPLWPLVLAAFQRLFGSGDAASALAGGACFAAGACLVFVLGRRWFNAPVGLAAAMLYIFSAQVLDFSISGLTEPLAMLLMLVWLYALTVVRPETWWKVLLLGGLSGLFYLARYNAILFLLPALIFLILRARRLSIRPKAADQGEISPVPGRVLILLCFLAGFLLVTGPWLYRNYSIAGSPFFSLQKYEPAMFTQTYPGYSLYMRPVKVDVPGFVLTHRTEVQKKVGNGWNNFRRNFLNRQFTGLALRVFVFFLLALLLPLDRIYPAQRGMRPLAAACFLLQLAALLPLHYIPRLFMIFVPVYMIYAAGAVWTLAHQACLFVAGRMASFPRSAWGRSGNLQATAAVTFAAAVLAAFVFLGARTNYPGFHPVYEGDHPTTLWATAVKDVSRLVPPDQVILSDQGQIFAWYSERFACKIPFSPQLLPEVCRLAPVRAIYISSWITWQIPEADRSWIRIYQERPSFLAGFQLAKAYPDGSLLYLRR